MQEPRLLPPPPACEHGIVGCAECPAYRQMYMYWKLSHPEGRVVTAFNGCKVQIGPLGENGYYCKIVSPDSTCNQKSGRCFRVRQRSIGR